MLQRYKKIVRKQNKKQPFFALWEIIINFAAGKESIGGLFAARR
jgi:hypothetical protein